MNNNNKDVSVLITGGCGMVGSHLAEYYYNLGNTTTATYHTHPTINLEEVKDKAHYVPCDIRNAAQVLEIIEQCMPDIIYHLAAQSYPTVSWEKPVETMDTNVNGTINVFEAVKKIRIAKPTYDPIVVIACSSAEYGASLTPENVPISEQTELLPLHPYGVSKVGQDLLGFQYYTNNKIRNIRARIFNTTGPRKETDVASDFTKRAVMFERGQVSSLKVGNLSTKRALTDVRDLVNALVLLAEHGAAGDVYNICGERVYEISSIVKLIEEIMGISLPLEVDPALIRLSDEPVIFGSSEKLKSCTNWEQKIDLKTTLSDMINYWKQALV